MLVFNRDQSNGRGFLLPFRQFTLPWQSLRPWYHRRSHNQIQFSKDPAIVRPRLVLSKMLKCYPIFELCLALGYFSKVAYVNNLGRNLARACARAAGGIEKVEHIFEELCSEKMRNLYRSCKLRFPVGLPFVRNNKSFLRRSRLKFFTLPTTIFSAFSYSPANNSCAEHPKRASSRNRFWSDGRSAKILIPAHCWAIGKSYEICDFTFSKTHPFAIHTEIIGEAWIRHDIST